MKTKTYYHITINPTHLLSYHLNKCTWTFPDNRAHRQYYYHKRPNNKTRYLFLCELFTQRVGEKMFSKLVIQILHSICKYINKSNMKRSLFSQKRSAQVRTLANGKRANENPTIRYTDPFHKVHMYNKLYIQ